MASDLKPMLAKVLSSGGEKKFFFAYGTGKRKDGKGDGELVVRGTRPKRAEVEGALADGKEVFEGVCWAGKGPDDAEAVYFLGQGKKLSPPVVAKMALAAKREAGRQYDFQVPSPEEEARAAAFADGDAAVAPAAAPAAAAAAPPPPGRPQELQTRLKALLQRQAAALGASPALKEKLLPLAQAASAAVVKGGADAARSLDALEAALDAAPVGGTPAAGAAPPAEGWTARLAEWTPAIKQALAAKGPTAAAVAKLFAQATALSKPGGDMAQSLEKLAECHALATAGTAPAGPATPGAGADALRARLQDVQAQAALLPEPARSELRGRAGRALAAAGSAGTAALAAEVDALEGDLAGAARAARAADAAGAAGDRATYRRLQFEWRDAQARARERLGRLAAAVLGDEEVRADPRFGEVKEAAGDLAELMPEFGDDIEAALGAIDDASDDAARAAALAKARAVLADYSAELDAAAGLGELQALADDEYGGLSFFTELRRALASLGAQLAKAG